MPVDKTSNSLAFVSSLFGKTKSNKADKSVKSTALTHASTVRDLGVKDEMAPQRTAARSSQSAKSRTSAMDAPIPRMTSDFMDQTKVENNWQKGMGVKANAQQIERFLDESGNLARIVDKMALTKFSRKSPACDELRANSVAFHANLSATLRAAVADAELARRLDNDPRWRNVAKVNEQLVGYQLHPSLVWAFDDKNNTDPKQLYRLR